MAKDTIQDYPIQISEKFWCLPPPSPASLVVESQSVEIPRLLGEVPPDFMVKFHFWYVQNVRPRAHAFLNWLNSSKSLHALPKYHVQ